MRMLYIVLMVTAVLAAGCSRQDFGRPVTSVVTDLVDFEKARNQRAMEEEALAKARRLARVLAEWNRVPDASTDYHFGPDDVLDVGILDFEEPGKVSHLLLTVGNDGAIKLPWAGMVNVDGLTAREAEVKIRTALQGKFLKDPQVGVLVSQHRSAPVVITGAVTKPGVYYLNRDRRSILEILAHADGLSGEAGSDLLLIRGPKKSTNAVSETSTLSSNVNPLISVDLRQLIDEGDLRHNLWVQGGDIVTVLPKARDVVYVLGYVNRPGNYEFRKDRPITPLQAVAMAGGLGSAARAENSFVLRKTAKGQEVISIDLTKYARTSRTPMMMQAGDTLVVGSSFFARLSEFIRPSMSYTYNLASPGL